MSNFNKMLIKLLCLLFIIKIRYPATKPISSTIRQKFGQDGLSKFRNVESTWRKLSKAKLDLHFLKCCKAYEVFPNFLKFKLYRSDLYNNEIYRDFKRKLLVLEIEDKIRKVNHFENVLANHRCTLKDSTTFIDYNCLLFYIQRNIVKNEDEVKASQKRKIEILGGKLELKKCDSRSVVFNYSDRILTSRETFLLSLGLDFKLPVFKPNFYRYYLHFENFISILKRCKLADGKYFSEVCELIKFKAKECFRNHASH